ncbi:uncharacterized protein LOC117332923 [Pecten maximus]|uniref:uncharacterized protein LOC117332923 n=1 Tax=Pecten maximus TaxID=6579 RepID=UPI0014587263|nr:uncharacterized protein LOC117332923 [Pecten maximus]
MASHQFQPLMNVAQTLKEVPSHLEDVNIHELLQLYPTQRLTVGGETLEEVDMVINSFLVLKKMEQNTSESNRHIYVLPSYTAVQWDQGHLAMDHWMFKKVQFSKYAHVFMPICINRNHLVLLVADEKKQRTVYVLDSMHGEVGHSWTRIWAEFMANRDSLPDVTEQFGVWNFPEIRSETGALPKISKNTLRLNAGATKSDSKCDMPDCRILKGFGSSAAGFRQRQPSRRNLNAASVKPCLDRYL